jgi:SAM-dependent methyltransferase
VPGPEPFADHFSDVAPEYARSRPAYPEVLFEFLASLPARRLLAWDCAAGSGQATLGLAERFARVVATDASAAQIAAAPARPNVEYRVASAGRSGLPAGGADLVAVAQALHWLDLPAFYDEVRRVLAPGGLLAAWMYPNARLDDPALDAAFDRFYAEVVGPWWPPERRHVEEAYRSLPFPFREVPAPAFTMEARWSLRGLVDYAGTWSAVARCRAETGADPLALLEAALAPLWGDPERPRIVRWPLTLRVGRP